MWWDAFVLDLDINTLNSWTGLAVSTFAICASLFAVSRAVYACLHRIEMQTRGLNDKFNQEALHQHFRHEANVARFNDLEKDVTKIDGEVDMMGRAVATNSQRIVDHLRSHGLREPE